MILETELSKENIKELINHESPIILEIGCYDGRDSAELNKLFDNAVFGCFEADRRSFVLFEKQNHPKNIVGIPTAIGKEDCEIDLYLSDSDSRRHQHNSESWSASSSIKKPKTHLDLFADVEFRDVEQVKCRSLDSFYIENIKGETIDFIWVDINGAEEDFILGAKSVLKYKTKYLYIEFSDKELYEGQITKEGILRLLPEFELEGVYNFKGNFGNLLLRNKNL